MKKILHIITDLKEGGAQKILLKIVSDKKSTQEHVVISLIGIGNYKNKLSNLNIRYYFLNMSNKRLNILKILKLHNIIKKEKPDAIQTWMYHCDLIGGLIARTLGIKKIFWGVVSFNLGADVMSLKSRIVVKINSLLSHFIPHKIIYCADSSRIVHEKIGFNKKKSVFIPIGFESKENRYQNIFIPQKIFTIGCIARWDPQKDHKNLLMALKILDDKNIAYKCKFIGLGMDEDNHVLSKLIDKTGVNSENLELLGYVENIDREIISIDLTVLSSAGEAFPNIIGEAMSMGIICVGTDVGDIKQIINKNGWTVPKRNHKKLAEALIIAAKEYQNFVEWKLMSERSQKHIRENYPLNLMVKKYYQTWS